MQFGILHASLAQYIFTVNCERRMAFGMRVVRFRKLNPKLTSPPLLKTTTIRTGPDFAAAVRASILVLSTIS